MRFAFSSDGLPEAERDALLREVYARSHLGCAITPLDGRPLSVRMEAVLPAEDPGRAIGVGGGRYGPMRAARDEGDATGEGILLSTGRNRFGVALAGGETIAGGGAVVTVTPMHRASRWIYPDAQEVSAVWVGRQDLADHAPGLDLDGLRALPADLPGLPLLFAYAAVLRETPPEGALGNAAARHIAELAALVLSQALPRAGSAVRAAHLAAIRRDMAQHFRDPDLTVATLAARHRISPRYLEMLFAPTGETAAARLLRLRLEAARHRLADPARRAERIGAIAFACGFRELSTFNRAFRRHYGIAPGEVRAG